MALEPKECRSEKEGRPADVAYSMNVGVQFGLTSATSDSALKFQGSVSF